MVTKKHSSEEEWGNTSLIFTMWHYPEHGEWISRSARVTFKTGLGIWMYPEHHPLLHKVQRNICPIFPSFLWHGTITSPLLYVQLLSVSPDLHSRSLQVSSQFQTFESFEYPLKQPTKSQSQYCLFGIFMELRFVEDTVFGEASF